MRFACCDGCGKCCTGPWVSRKEMQEIADSGMGAPQVEIRTLDGFRVLYHILPVDGKCPFVGNGGCRLKRAPIACRIYPLFPSQEYGWYLRDSCPRWSQITKEEIAAAIQEFEQEHENWMEW